LSHLLVIGASKGIGLETVKQSLSAGHHVRAMARSATQIKLDHPNLEKFDGNALTVDDVRRGLDGVNVVIQALGISIGPSALVKPNRLFSDATRLLVPAMEESSVKRLLCVTGFGAGDSRYRGNILYNLAFKCFLARVYSDKDIQERIIRRSELDWIIARPGILTNGALTGSYQVLVEPADWRSGSISRADVADFLVKQIDDDTLLGKTPALIQ
jgi:putative NADH-flavin reductase